MKPLWLGVAGSVVPALLVAQTTGGPYARIALLRPLDGHAVEFEAGYVRHLEWHRQVRDPWVWYGWSVQFGDRQRWFVYATFGHSAMSLDSPVSPAEDERDNVLNVAPHVEYAGNALYEFLPALSRGTGVPQPSPRLELTTFDLVPGAAPAFETALAAVRSALPGEALWFRMVAGGAAPRYVRLRPVSGIAAVLDGSRAHALPDGVHQLTARLTVEILVLRPTMSYGLTMPPPGGAGAGEGRRE